MNIALWEKMQLYKGFFHFFFQEVPVHGGRFREVFSEAQQEELKSYLTLMDKMFFGLTKKQCRRLVFDFAEECGISHPFNKETKMAGEDWLSSFMTKHQFSIRKPEATSIARAMGFNKPSVDMFFSIIKELRDKHKFPASSIYNADESGLSTVPNKLPLVISPKGSRRVSKVVSGERGRNVTIICCISATGFYLPPLLVFARKRMLPELVERAPPGTVGFCSDNGWSNCDIFVSFLKHFNLHAKPSKEVPALLIVDNHKTHVSLEAIKFCRDNNIIMVGFPPHTSHRLQPLDVSFFGPLKSYYSQACDNFMVTHPGQPITDKKVGEILSNAYFKAATVGNAVNGFKESGIEPYNPMVFSEHDFAAAITTDRDVIPNDLDNPTDMDELNNPDEPTDPEPLGSTQPNAGENLPDLPMDSDQGKGEDKDEEIKEIENSKKTSKSIFELKPLPKANPSVRKRKSNKLFASVLTSTPVKNALEEKVEQKAEQERLKQKRKEAREAKKVVKKLKLSPCKAKKSKSTVIPNSKIKKEPNVLSIRNLPDKSTSQTTQPFDAVASTSKDSIVKCPACDVIFSDPPIEEWIQCCKCQLWWHEDCSNFEGGAFICDFC